jgi:hypothetical protein
VWKQWINDWLVGTNLAKVASFCVGETAAARPAVRDTSSVSEAPAAIAPAIRHEGLAAYYKMEGYVQDSSGNNRTGRS